MSRFDRTKPSDGEDPFASIPDVDERLADWVDGTMSERDRLRFEAEFRVSPHAREQVDEYERTVATIREALGAKTYESNLADRVMGSIVQEAAAGGPRIRSRLSLVWASMSAAALLGIAVLINAWGGAMQAPDSQATTAAQEPMDRVSIAADEAANDKTVLLRPEGEDSLDSGKLSIPSGLAPEMSVEIPGTRLDRSVKAGAAKSTRLEQIGMSEVPEVDSTAPGSRVGAGEVGSAATSAAGETSAAGGTSTAGGSTSPEPSGRTIEEAGVGEPRASSRYGSRSARPSGSPGKGTAKPAAPPSAVMPETESAPIAELERAIPDVENPDVVGGVSEAETTASVGKYWFRLAAPKQDGDVLPLVTIDGFAVASDPSRRLPNAQQRAKGSTASEMSIGDDFPAGQLSFVEFFASQMLPAAEWQQQAIRKKLVETDRPKPLRGRQQLSLGQLQVFAVAGRSDLEQQIAAEERSAGVPAETPRGVVARPGARQAQDAASAERDWLVVGPQSEVAKLLASLRKYSDSVRSSWKSGEVRIATGIPPGKDLVESVGVDSESATGRPSSKLPPASRDPSQSSASHSRPVQRVVLRFRVRR